MHFSQLILYSFISLPDPFAFLFSISTNLTWQLYAFHNFTAHWAYAWITFSNVFILDYCLCTLSIGFPPKISLCWSTLFSPRPTSDCEFEHHLIFVSFLPWAIYFEIQQQSANMPTTTPTRKLKLFGSFYLSMFG